MIDIQKFSDIALFANFNVYHWENKDIIVYDDHRCLLTVLFEAKKFGLIDEQTNLITFDLHDDARHPHHKTAEKLEEIKKIGLAKFSSRDFKSFIEFDISEDDGDWVTVGMELGLIGNILNIGCEENFNITNWKNNRYESKDGRQHLGFVIGHLKDALNPHGGKVADVSIQENDRIRKLLCFDNSGPFPSICNDPDIVLDFDLDCFTSTCMEKRFAWPEHIFREEYGWDGAAGFFIHELIRKSKFITICREPSYCGGIGESNKILEYLDNYFFCGCLGTKTIM